MGHNIDPADPVWQGCGGGCFSLPTYLQFRWDTYGDPDGAFTGEMKQLELQPCSFTGWAENDVGYKRPVAITFCESGTSDLYVYIGPSIPIILIAPNNHLNIPLKVILTTGSNWSLT